MTLNNTAQAFFNNSDNGFVSNLQMINFQTKGNGNSAVLFTQGQVRIENSYLVGVMTGNSSYNGGFAGRILTGTSYISNSYTYMQILGSGSQRGFFAGSNSGLVTINITDSYFLGELNNTSGGLYTGGAIGYLSGSTSALTLDNVQVGANINGANYTGGVVGGTTGYPHNGRKKRDHQYGSLAEKKTKSPVRL